MEKEELEQMVTAVTRAVKDLEVRGEKEEKGAKEEKQTEYFTCPDCEAKVLGYTKYCPTCGCELEWGA